MSKDTLMRSRSATNAADGMMRKRWTLDEIEKLVAAGIFDEFDRFELIGGELVPMSPEGNHHEHLRNVLSKLLARMAPDEVGMGFEPQLNLSEDEFRNPDILLYPATRRIHDVRGPDALLVIEIADSSLRYDTGSKAETYARFGVRDCRVINAQTRDTRVFRSPDPAQRQFTEQSRVPAEGQLQALLVPEVRVTLSEID
jgi:Uma2 family endonuclease